jgi:hypothetical protein
VVPAGTPKQVLRFLLVISLIFTSLPAFAQEQQRGRVGTFIRQTIFVDSTRRAAKEGQVVDEERAFRKYNGKTIGTITISRHDVFERRRSLFQKGANWMHVTTRESTVRSDLLVAEGDIFDASKVVRSNQILQGRHYISQAVIYASPDPRDLSKVNLRVIVFDSWTIGVRGAAYAGERAMGELYDVNFAGSGARVGLKSYFHYGKGSGGGEALELSTPNFFGSFYAAELRAGRDFESKRLELAFRKDFILPDDYAAGASYSDIDDAHFEVYLPHAPGAERVWRRRAAVWGGQSWRFMGRTNTYLTGSFNHEAYPARPHTTARGVNPQFHDRSELLVGAGFYGERFFRSSMIYGYGFEEYIAVGTKAEATGGLSWQEFGNYYYGGGRFIKGGFWNGGYLSADLSAGTYWHVNSGARYRSVLSGELFWFSNLWGRGRNKFREFVKLCYTQGWNMGSGAGAVVGFSGPVRPLGFKDYGVGRTRLLLNTETVVFTQHRPWGFRLAVFAFGDAGFVGMNDNPLRNDFFSTFGLGIRFKNERLVFKALQLRLGFAVGKSGFVRSQIVSASTEQRIIHQRFVPYAPEVAGFE